MKSNNIITKHKKYGTAPQLFFDKDYYRGPHKARVTSKVVCLKDEA